MEIWITEPLILEGDYVKLIPLTKEHLPELEVIAKNEKIWEHFPYNGADSRVFIKDLNCFIRKT